MCFVVLLVFCLCLLQPELKPQNGISPQQLEEIAVSWHKVLSLLVVVLAACCCTCMSMDLLTLNAIDVLPVDPGGC